MSEITSKSKLDKMSSTELRALGKKHKITNYSRMKKKELAEALWTQVGSKAKEKAPAAEKPAKKEGEKKSGAKKPAAKKKSTKKKSDSKKKKETAPKPSSENAEELLSKVPKAPAAQPKPPKPETVKGTTEDPASVRERQQAAQFCAMFQGIIENHFRPIRESDLRAKLQEHQHSMQSELEKHPENPKLARLVIKVGAAEKCYPEHGYFDLL